MAAVEEILRVKVSTIALRSGNFRGRTIVFHTQGFQVQKTENGSISRAGEWDTTSLGPVGRARGRLGFAMHMGEGATMFYIADFDEYAITALLAAAAERCNTTLPPELACGFCYPPGYLNFLEKGESGFERGVWKLWKGFEVVPPDVGAYYYLPLPTTPEKLKLTCVYFNGAPTDLARITRFFVD